MEQPLSAPSGHTEARFVDIERKDDDSCLQIEIKPGDDAHHAVGQALHYRMLRVCELSRNHSDSHVRVKAAIQLYFVGEPSEGQLFQIIALNDMLKEWAPATETFAHMKQWLANSAAEQYQGVDLQHICTACQPEMQSIHFACQAKVAECEGAMKSVLQQLEGWPHTKVEIRDIILIKPVQQWKDMQPVLSARACRLCCGTMGTSLKQITMRGVGSHVHCAVLRGGRCQSA